MKWEPSVWPDKEALGRAAAQELAGVAAGAVRSRGRFDCVLAGGHTPQRLYEILAADYCRRIDWEHTHLFFGDERYVPHDDARSNYRMVRQAMLDSLGMPASNVHPIPTSYADPEDAARAYEKTLREHFGGSAIGFDLLLLGVGGEGHTASLFPGSQALAERNRLVVSVRVQADPPVRLTMTFPALDAAQDVFFLVAGEEKKGIVAKLLNARPQEVDEFPAAQVRPRGRVILYLDQAAMGASV